MRKRELAIGLAGVCVGAWLAGQWTGVGTAPVPLAVVPPAAPAVVPAPIPPPPVVEAKPVEARSSLEEKPLPQPRFELVARSLTTTSAAPAYVGLRLDETLVRELESLPASELAAAGEVLRTQEGWRFRQLDPRSAWVRAGLREEDVLPYGALGQQSAIPARARLAGRLAAVLARVSR